MIPAPSRNALRRKARPVAGLTLRTNNLLAGKLILPLRGRLPAIVLSSAVQLVEIILVSRTRFRVRPGTVRLHRGIGVRLHPGILFGIIPECRSASSRNRVHLAPDSQIGKPTKFMPSNREIGRCLHRSSSEAVDRGGSVRSFLRLCQNLFDFLCKVTQHKRFWQVLHRWITQSAGSRFVVGIT